MFIEDFIKATGGAVITKDAKTKRVDGVDLPSSSFAYVGDKEDPSTWKLPIHFPGDEEKTKTHIRNALARFDQTDLPKGEKSKVHARIVAAAKEHGIEVSTEKVLKAEIDSPSVIGEPGTGFEKRNRDGKSGPFECGNCNFFDGTSCGQKDMIEKTKQPKNAEGRPEVDKLDCCEYVDRVA